MKKDNRQIPYNIWIIFLSILIFIAFGGIGTTMIYVGWHTGVSQDNSIASDNFESIKDDLRLKCIKDVNCSIDGVKIQKISGYTNEWIENGSIYYSMKYQPYYTDLESIQNKIMIHPSWQMAIAGAGSFFWGIIIWIWTIIAIFNFYKKYWWKK